MESYGKGELLSPLRQRPHSTDRSTSFAFFLVGVTLKSIIVQLTVQIVANRISILITDPQRKRYLRWGPFGLVLALNIGVYCIWIPAHLRISTTFVDINHYYSRCEKVIYTLADASLNVYFCYLVKSRLISAGMAKYTRLYRFNICIIVVNLSMDVLLIGSMSLPNELVYVQLYPVVYMAKLNIEMSMAETISKVARSSNEATGRGAARKGDDLCSTSEHGYHSSVDSGMMLAPAKLDVGPRVPVNTASRASIVGRSPQRHFDRQASVYNSLYHAWVSGGMSSQAHLGTRGSRQKQGDRGPEFEVGNGPTLAVDGAKEQQNVITKDTVVHVRTESVRNVPTPTRGDVDR